MTGRRSSTLQLRLLRVLTALALVWPGALLAHAYGDADHARTPASATGATDRAVALDLDAPIAALPGASAELVATRVGEPPVTRSDGTRASMLRACGIARPAARHARPRTSTTTRSSLASREPTLACGFVSARPTAPPLLRS